MERVNIDILGISEPNWTGMSEFNSDDHYIYCCGQDSLRRNGIAIIINKKVQNTVLGCYLKNDRMISVRFQGKPLTTMVVKSMTRQVILKKLKLNGSVKTYKTFKTDTQKRCPFHYRGLEFKSSKSRNIWNNRKMLPWNKE